jgi:hypothetical protein
MGKITEFCKGCRKALTLLPLHPYVREYACPIYEKTNWVNNRKGCAFNIPGTKIDYLGSNKK